MYIGILDDDSRFIDILKDSLANYGDNTYKVFHSVTVDIFKENFDMFFLDVMLGDKESFIFGEKLTLRKPEMTLVYISSIDHFVYDSIYLTSFFFVRKSNLDNDLPKLFDKYNKRLFADTKVLDFISNSCKQSVLQRDIIHITSRKNSVTITTNDKEYIVYKSLKYIYKLLDKNSFYKLNSYTVLNFEHIKKVTEQSIILVNGKEHFFSRESKKPFMNAYGIFKRFKL